MPERAWIWRLKGLRNEDSYSGGGTGLGIMGARKSGTERDADWCDWMRERTEANPPTCTREKRAPRAGDSTLNTPAQDVSGATKNLSLKEPCNMHVSSPQAGDRCLQIYNFNTPTEYSTEYSYSHHANMPARKKCSVFQVRSHQFNLPVRSMACRMSPALVPQ